MTHPTRTPRVMNGQSRTADKFVVRLEEGLRDRIAVLARAGRQSMNAYIVSALNGAVTRGEDSVVEKRALIGPNMPCRFKGVPFLVIKSYFLAGELVTDIVDGDGAGLCVGYNELEPY